LVDPALHSYKCSACGHYETPQSRIFQGWDKCEECEGQLEKNPDYEMREAPMVIVKGGSTYAPAKSPRQLKREAGKKLRAQKIAIKRGKGTVIEKDLAITKLTLESKADEYKSGELAFDVPRGMDAGLKPEMPVSHYPVCAPEAPAKKKAAAKAAQPA